MSLPRQSGHLTSTNASTRDLGNSTCLPLTSCATHPLWSWALRRPLTTRMTCPRKSSREQHSLGGPPVVYPRLQLFTRRAIEQYRYRRVISGLEGPHRRPRQGREDTVDGARVKTDGLYVFFRDLYIPLRQQPVEGGAFRSKRSSRRPLDWKCFGVRRDAGGEQPPWEPRHNTLEPSHHCLLSTTMPLPTRTVSSSAKHGWCRGPAALDGDAGQG
jgi:hypothetical protein